MNCFRRRRCIPRIGSELTLSAACATWCTIAAWQMGLGADVTFYSKPAVLDAAYGAHPVSFQIFLRFRPGLSTDHHMQR